MQWHRDATNHQKADVRLSWTTICLFHQLTETERTSPSSCLAHCTLVFSAQAEYKHQRSLTGQSCIHWVRRFHSSSTVFLTLSTKGWVSPRWSSLPTYSVKPFVRSKATAGSGSWVIQQAWHRATLPSEPKATGRNPSAVLQCITRWSSTTRLCLTIFR